MNPLYGIYGCGGCGRGIMPLARDQLAISDSSRLVFIDDGGHASTCNGHDVMTFEDFAAVQAPEKRVAVAIAGGTARRVAVERCEAANISFFEVAAANHIRMDDVTIGEGALLSPFTVFTSNIRIGRHFHANLYSYVEHDCVIGDFVTFAPGVHCNGNIVIEDDVYVGAGVTIRQGRAENPLHIGRGAVIGMGAVVTKDVPAGATMVGNPARPLVRQAAAR